MLILGITSCEQDDCIVYDTQTFEVIIDTQDNVVNINDEGSWDTMIDMTTYGTTRDMLEMIGGYRSIDGFTVKSEHEIVSIQYNNITVPFTQTRINSHEIVIQNSINLQDHFTARSCDVEKAYHKISP